MATLNILNVAVCTSRHPMPSKVKGGIFGKKVDDPMDISTLENTAANYVNAAHRNGVRQINLYVTGLTQATIAVINACAIKRIRLVVYHYNRDTDEHVPQLVIGGV